MRSQLPTNVFYTLHILISIGCHVPIQAAYGKIPLLSHAWFLINKLFKSYALKSDECVIFKVELKSFRSLCGFAFF